MGIPTMSWTRLGALALGVAALLFGAGGALGAEVPGTITTVAGGGNGDGGPATSAPLNSPGGVAVDGSGNLFIADTNNHRIRKVTTDGTITTVAGNGDGGFSGDGGAATSATLGFPQSVAVDASGNLFIADTNNYRIRKVATNGTITTVAGNGSYGFSGDGDAATSATLGAPRGVAVDGSGNLFIADTGNHRIRRVAGDGTITTVAGDGTGVYSGGGYSGDGGAATSATLNGPFGVAVDGSGNLFIADTGNCRIRKVATNGTIATVAGNGNSGFSGDGGAATSAMLYEPYSVGMDGSGNVFIADRQNHRIRKVATNGTITTVAGNGTGGFSGDGGIATSAGLAFPDAVAIDGSGNLFISDNDSHRIRKVATNGTITTVAGNGSNRFSGDGGAATSAMLGGPSGVAVDGSGNLFIADSGNYRIRKVASDGTISTFAGNGASGFSGDGGAATSATLSGAAGVAVDRSGNLFIVSGDRIRKVASDGTISTFAGNGASGFSGDGGAATSAKLNSATGVAVDGSGNLFIADTLNHRIRRVAADGTITTIAGNGTSGFSGDGGAAISAQLSYPTHVAVDGSGNVFIAAFGNGRVRRVATNGTITTVAGNGTWGFSGDGGAATSAMLRNPRGVAVDGSGNLFIADYENARIRKVATDGTITTVAGNGTVGFSGDGGVATSAMLSSPYGVAVDGSGNLFIVDAGNNRIRRVAGPGAVPLTVTATAADKPFDGTTAATVTLASDKLPADVVTISFTSATFADAEVGAGKTVTVSGIAISGADAGKYALVSTTATATAAITAPVARVFGLDDGVPVYDIEAPGASLLAGRTRYLIPGDWDGDGLPDVVNVTHRGAQVFHNDGTVEGRLALRVVQDLDVPYSFGGGAADVDRDGDLDLVLGDFNTVRIAVNDGHGLFVLTTAYTHNLGDLSLAVPYHTKSNPLDAEDEVRIVVGPASDGLAAAFVLRQSSPGTWSVHATLDQFAVDGFRPFDADGDGDTDLLACNRTGHTTSTPFYVYADNDSGYAAVGGFDTTLGPVGFSAGPADPVTGRSFFQDVPSSGFVVGE